MRMIQISTEALPLNQARRACKHVAKNILKAMETSKDMFISQSLTESQNKLINKSSGVNKRNQNNPTFSLFINSHKKFLV